ncbi:uncharacterized protein [Clytia hemisphaerica]|uniref:uncharacterized protein n=1 Tax=Clytia hemisphaerica TaxID=252671 RepID=UPI0034D47321
MLLTHDGPYKQVDGLAMGSQPDPCLANIWLSKFEEFIKDDAKIFERYMDDILRSIKRQHIDQKLIDVNDDEKIHKNLKFTLEIEEDGKLPFLNVCIIHKGNSLESTWYCKPTDTGLMMNFHALSPKRYKRNVVSGIVHRIYRVCSHWRHFHESLQRAKSMLEKNQYPPEFYDPIISSTIEKIISKENKQLLTSNQEPKQKQAKVKFFVEYCGKVTDNFINHLHKDGAPVQPVVTLRKLKTTLPSLKPSIKRELKSGVIYKISCPRCNSCYVGQTARHVITRFKEHRNRKEGPVRMRFMRCCKRKPEFEDLEILVSTIKGEVHLLTIEALFIREIKPDLNTKDEFKSRQLLIKI